MIVEDGLSQVAQAIRSPRVKLLFEHWREKRGERLMPGWRDIDPMVISPIMPMLWSWKYDRTSDSFTGRLAGEEINAIFGKSLRGARMEDFFRDWNFASIFERHKRVVSEPCIAIGHGMVFSHAGRQGFGERVILPLADDGAHGDGIIGATLYDLSRPADSLFEAANTTPESRFSEDVRYFPLQRRSSQTLSTR